MLQYNLSKTTTWHHIKDVELSEDAERILRSKGGQVKGQRVWEKAEKFALETISAVDVRAAWPVLLATLYWCEGTKRSGFVFTNTDPNMIVMFLKIMRENLRVPDDDFDILIRTCKPMNSIACRRYWSAVTGLSIRNIRNNHHDLYNRSKTKYGMCRITVRKGNFYLKVMHCLIAIIIDKIVPLEYAPVAQWIELRSPNAVT